MRLPLPLLGLVALTCASWTQCHSGPPEPLRVGANPWPGYETVYLARSEGLYERPVELVDFGSLADVRRAFERGDIDGFCGTLVEVIEAAENSDREPQIVAVADYSNGADVVLATVPTLGDLRGRRVAVEPDSLTIFVASRALESAGLGLDDVELVALDSLEMPRALSDGKVDAIVTYPPHSLKAAANEGVKALFDSSQIPGEVVDVIAFDRRVLEARPQDVEAILAGWGRAHEMVARERERAFSIMAARQGLSPEEFAAAYEGGITVLGPEDQEPFFGSDGRLRSYIQRTAEALQASGEVQSLPSAEGLVWDFGGGSRP